MADFPDADTVAAVTGSGFLSSILTWWATRKKDAGTLALEIAEQLRDELGTLREENQRLQSIAAKAEHAVNALLGAVDGLLLALELPADKRGPLIERAKAARAKVAKAPAVGD